METELSETIVYVCLNRRAYPGTPDQQEELDGRMSVDKSLEEFRRKIQRELEERKLDMLEVSCIICPVITITGKVRFFTT